MDATGFDELVRDRAKALVRTAYLLTGDWSRAEDLVQTALTKTYVRWSALAHPSVGEAYARRVMVTTYCAWWRRRWNDETPVAQVPDQSLPEWETTADARVSLQHALATLPRRQRTILVLRFFADQTEAQVAAELGITVGTVKSSSSKALAALRAQLEPSVIDLSDGARAALPEATT